MTFNLPKNVKLILDRLENAGFEAYCVGGCVRDSLMGALPEDWDIPPLPYPKKHEQFFLTSKLLIQG